MATQLKKGTFEICILAILTNKDAYGYELTQELNELIPVKESTVYLILQRLEKSGILTSYVKMLEDSAKARKYYKITDSGKDYLDNLLSEWKTLEEVIQKCIEKGELNHD